MKQALRNLLFKEENTHTHTRVIPNGPLRKGTNQAMKPITEPASIRTHEVLIAVRKGPYEATKTRRKLAKNEDI
jgi:hypothetical protein